MTIDRRSVMRNIGVAAVSAAGVAGLATSAEGQPLRDGHNEHGSGGPSDPTAGVTRTLLQSHPSPAKGWQAVQTLVQIPVTKESGRHSHPGVEVGYIIHGEVLMEFDEGNSSLRLQTGDPFFIPAGAIHNARNVGAVKTMMLSTYVVDASKPLVTEY
ncbi:cupin domain-containing protein [Streptomyces sp. NPDC046985]|uniref:cupin domain-containing protein n=1 Tax=Streptomyces sp. NPDC046985 TaxID=3155377 RepID=UPI0033D1039A